MNDNVVGSAAVEVRAPLDQLRADFRAARKETQQFSDAAGKEATREIEKLRGTVARLDREIVSLNKDMERAAHEIVSLRGASEGAAGATGKLMNAARALAGAYAALGLGRVVMQGLEYAASLGEQAQQIGITTRELQIYRYAATQVGLTTEEMDGAIQKLNRTLGNAQTGSKEAGETFKALGIDIKDANGRFLTAGEVLPKVADAIAKIENPAQRAAAEVKLFGRAGADIDTLLTGGSAAINALADAAERAGIILSDEQIQKADETADKLAAVKMVLEARIAGVVADNAQAIYGLAESLAAAATEGFRFVRAIDDVLAGADEIKAKEGYFAFLSTDISEMRARGATQRRMRTIMSGDPLADFKKAPAPVGDNENVKLFSEGGSKKRKAALTDEQRELKRLSELRKRTIEDLRNEVEVTEKILPLWMQQARTEDEIADKREMLTTLHRLEISATSDEAREIENLIDKRRQLNATIEAQREIRSGEEELEILREIAPLYGQQSIQLGEIADRREALERIQALNIDANSKEAQTIRDQIAERRKLNEEEAKRSLRKGAEDQIDAIYQEAEAIGMTREQLARFRTEQELLNEAEQAGLAITPELRAEIAAYAEQVGVATEMLDQMERQQQAIIDANGFFKDELSSAFDDLLFKGESLGETFRNLALSIAKAAMQGALFGQGPLGGLLGNGGGGLLGGLFGGETGGSGGVGGILSGLVGGGKKSGGGGIFGNMHPASGIGDILSTMGPKMFAGIFHSGTSRVGSGGMQRPMPVSAFINAPRFHNGLFRSGEYPAILEEGEEVIPKNRAGKRASGGVTINQNVYPRDYDSFRRTQRQQSRALKQQFR
jgi:hypothetical protein